MKYRLLLCLLPLLRLAYWLGGFLPRDPSVWVFGSYGNAFNDNSKYLFTHVTENCPDIKAVWITANPAVVQRIRRAGGIAFMRWSVMGLYHALRARYWFVSAYVSDINYYLSRNARLMNLWHGVPLKKIEFDIEAGPLAQVFQRPTFLQRHLTNANLFRRPEWVLSTSAEVGQTSFASAFRVAQDKILVAGYPRTDVFFWEEDTKRAWMARWESEAFISLYDHLKSFDRVFLYMPTWRDGDPRFLEKVQWDLAQLGQALRAHNAILLLKLHVATPPTVVDAFRGVDGVHVLDASQDVYPLLPLSTGLISDYSSIYLDYLLLDRPVRFFAFDLDKYLQESRGFYYQYADVTPGLKIDQSDQVNAFVVDPQDGHGQARRQLAARMFYHREGGASQRIVDFIRADRHGGR